MSRPLAWLLPPSCSSPSCRAAGSFPAIAANVCERWRDYWDPQPTPVAYPVMDRGLCRADRRPAVRRRPPDRHGRAWHELPSAAETLPQPGFNGQPMPPKIPAPGRYRRGEGQAVRTGRPPTADRARVARERCQSRSRTSHKLKGGGVDDSPPCIWRSASRKRLAGFPVAGFDLSGWVSHRGRAAGEAQARIHRLETGQHVRVRTFANRVATCERRLHRCRIRWNHRVCRGVCGCRDNGGIYRTSARNVQHPPPHNDHPHP